MNANDAMIPVLRQYKYTHNAHRVSIKRSNSSPRDLHFSQKRRGGIGGYDRGIQLQPTLHKHTHHPETRRQNAHTSTTIVHDIHTEHGQYNTVCILFYMIGSCENSAVTLSCTCWKYIFFNIPRVDIENHMTTLY